MVEYLIVYSRDHIPYTVRAEMAAAGFKEALVEIFSAVEYIGDGV